MEEVKEARSAILLAITLSVIWLLVAGSVKEELRTKRLVEELGAWVLLSEAIDIAFANDRQAIGVESYEGAFNGVTIGGEVSSYKSAVFDNRSNEGLRNHTLIISPPWLPGENIAFTLTRIDAPEGLEIFRIDSDDELVNQSRYHVGEFRNGVPEVHSEVMGSLSHIRSYYDALFLNGGMRGPNSADAVLSYLRSLGWEGQTERDLRSTDPVIAKTIVGVRQQRHTIASLPLTVTLVPAAIGAMLALGAFNLVGPIIRIGTGVADPSEGTWTFALKTGSAKMPFLAPLQIIAAGVCVGLFVFVAFSILGFRSLLRPSEVGLAYLGGLGASLMAFASIAFFRAVFAKVHSRH